MRTIVWSSTGRSPDPSGLALDRVDRVHALGDLAEDGVLAVEPIGLDVGDVELAAVRVRSGIGHGEGTYLVLKPFIAGEFVVEAVAGAAAACGCRHPRPAP